jgi:dTDP-glucose 4,6-dehydratase
VDAHTKPLLVTGGAGFIGSALVRIATARGRRVVNVDALTYAGNLASLRGVDPSLHQFVQADVTDGRAMAEVFATHQPSAVVHLAAETHVDRSIDAPAAFLQTNLLGTAALLDASLAYYRTLDDADRARFRFVHTSTDEVFGSLGPDGWFDVGTPYDPRSPYAATKAGSDHLVRAWHHTYGLPTVVSNCGNNYGPYQFPEKLIPLMTLKGLAGERLPVYGSGLNVRDWIHVDDHAEALLAMTEAAPGETYLVGARGERTNLQVVHALCDILDALVPERAPHASLITYVADRPGHDFRYAIDPTHALAGLPWAPRRRFEEGLEQTVRWYRDNAWWWQPILSGAYRLERLGVQS